MRTSVVTIRHFLLYFGLSIGLFAMACSTKPESVNCKKDGDCSVGNRCTGGSCILRRFPQLPGSTQKEITDSLTRQPMKKVDILLIIDNSGSMKEEQAKLASLFEKWSNNSKLDVQIAVISTDMSDPKAQGRFQGSPRIVHALGMMKADAIKALKQNIMMGTRGSSFEKPLDAMRAALSPKLLNDPTANKGFLRPGARLEILFLSDEDDCSHNGKIHETEVPSAVCHMPKTEFIKDETGVAILNSNGQPTYGQIEDLTPVSDYVQFLKGLKREVIVEGFIGDPLISSKTRPNKTPPTTSTSCQSDAICSTKGTKHFCAYSAGGKQTCGGCESKDGRAMPGFRLHEVMKAFGGSDSWSSVCGSKQIFTRGFSRAGFAMGQLSFLALSKRPDLDRMKVQIQFEGGRAPLSIKRAKPFDPTRSCKDDSLCGKSEKCGQDGRCYGSGWIYYLMSGQPTIVLSGSAKLEFAPSTQKKILKATYLPEK